MKIKKYMCIVHAYWRCHMRLKDYLMTENIKSYAFAKELGVSTTYFSQVTLNRKVPSVKIAKAIEEKTGGKVKKEELLFPEEYRYEIVAQHIKK